MKRQKAFTLIELSVVVIIIGILITSIMQGLGMIKTSRISSARVITTKSPVPEIEGLVTWYETTQLAALKEGETIDTNQTSEWYDQTPGSTMGLDKENILTKAATADLIVKSNGINKIPSLNFTSAGKITLANFYQGSSAQSTIFLVFQPTEDPTATAQVIFDADTSNSTLSIGIKDDAVCLNAGLGEDCTTTITNPASIISNRNYILAAYFNESFSRVFLNDVVDKIGAADLSPGANELDGLTIGTDKDGNNEFTGLISEIIVYNRPLRLQERRDVMNYLSRKYKISITGL